MSGSVNFNSQFGSKLKFGEDESTPSGSASSLKPPAMAASAKAQTVVATAHRSPLVFDEQPSRPLATISASPLVAASKGRSPINFGDFNPDGQQALAEHVTGTNSGIREKMNQPLASGQMIRDQMKSGGALSVQSITQMRDIVNKASSQYAKEFDEAQKKIKEKIDDYSKGTRELNKEYTDYAVSAMRDARKPGFELTQAHVDSDKRFQSLVSQVTNALYTAAKQMMELEELRLKGVIEGFDRLVVFAYNERIKEIEILKKMLDTVQGQEKHEVTLFVEYQAAYLNEESVRYQQLIDYVKLQADCYEKQQTGKLAADDQAFQQLMQVEGALVTRFQAEGEHDIALKKLEDDKELAVQQMKDKTTVARWNADLQARELDLQDGQVKLQLETNTRIQLADIAARDAIESRRTAVMAKAVDAEERVGMRRAEAEENTGRFNAEAAKVVGVARAEGKARVGVANAENDRMARQTESIHQTRRVGIQAQADVEKRKMQMVENLAKPKCAVM